VSFYYSVESYSGSGVDSVDRLTVGSVDSVNVLFSTMVLLTSGGLSMESVLLSSVVLSFSSV